MISCIFRQNIWKEESQDQQGRLNSPDISVACTPVLDEAVSESCVRLQSSVTLKEEPIGHMTPHGSLCRLTMQPHSQEYVCLQVLLLLHADNCSDLFTACI